MDSVSLSQQDYGSISSYKRHGGKQRKNPAVEAVVLFSKCVNNLCDELCEDYFLSVFRRNLPEG